MALKRDDGEGYLYFKSGRIVNAALGNMTGMDAACPLLAWPNASFSISRGGEDISEVIHVGMQNLIIEAMRLLDEGVTVTDRIADELAMINELFEARDLVALPVLEKVRSCSAMISAPERDLGDGFQSARSQSYQGKDI